MQKGDKADTFAVGHYEEVLGNHAEPGMIERAGIEDAHGRLIVAGRGKGI